MVALYHPSHESKLPDYRQAGRPWSGRIVRLRGLLRFTGLGLSVLLGTTACAGRPIELPPAGRVRPVAFGLARASETDIALLVPPGRRHVSYDWDRVPNRDSYVQVLRSCDFFRRVMRVPAVTRDRWWCWDSSQRALIQLPDADDFGVVVRQHPDWVWLIANEPDQDDQDDLSPEQYAEFFGSVATVVADSLKGDSPDSVARLVFCQISSPAHRDYCERAYFALKALFARRHWPELPETVTPGAVIHAVSVHNYLLTFSFCDTYRSRCYGSQLEEHHLAVTTARWAWAMDEFARWAHQLDSGALAQKPLWLTEFGALFAFCPRGLEMRAGHDRVGGVGCPRAASRQNGRREDDFVFYGRNEREGLWGAQRATLSYLLTSEGHSSGDRGTWAAAWWFNSRINWLDRGECAVTAWLFGHAIDCTQDLGTISRAGETYRDTLECLINSQRCPERLTPPSP